MMPFKIAKIRIFLMTLIIGDLTMQTMFVIGLELQELMT